MAGERRRDTTVTSPPGKDTSARCDVVFTGARVIDPESGLDGIRDVGVTGRLITEVSSVPVAAVRTVDASGCVLAPGFIDLHSHAQTRPGALLQALDGVTTALELELGTVSTSAVLSSAEQEGRPINYGYSASWQLTRMRLFDNAEPDEPFAMAIANQNHPNWRLPASSRDVARLLDALESEVADGAIGIGVLLGYASGTHGSEYFALARRAARLNVPTFTHTRYMSTCEPHSSLEGALEVISAAAGTGAHMHMCHLNSSSNRMIDLIAGAVERAREYGVEITTEAYPYGSSSTAVGAEFLAPNRLRGLGITADRILYLPTGERIADERRLEELRAADPAGLAIVQWADEEVAEDRDLLLRSLLLPDTAIASDSMPATLPGGGLVREGWPLPEAAMTHPRSGGCFARTFSWLVRELGVLSMSEAVRRCSLLPAQFLQESVPAMRAKGRVRPGADADIVVFDPEVFADQGSYRLVAPSLGVQHLMVGGSFVVEGGRLDTASRAGRPVRGGQ